VTGTHGTRSTGLAIAIAIALPVLLWWRLVSPLRQAGAAMQTQNRWLMEEREELQAKLTGPDGETSSFVRAVRAVRGELDGLPATTPGVSEVYRRLEDVAVHAGVRIVRIEPGSERDSETAVGPLGLRALESSRRSFRLDFKADTVALPYFLDLIQQIDGLVEIVELRLQGTPGDSSVTTGTIVFELLAVRNTAVTEDAATGGGS